MATASLEQVLPQSDELEKCWDELLVGVVNSVPEGRHDIDSELAAVSIIKKVSASRSSVQVIEQNLENRTRRNFYISISHGDSAVNPISAGCGTWDPRLGGRTGGVEASGDYVESHDGRKCDPKAANVVKESVIDRITNVAMGIRL